MSRCDVMGCKKEQAKDSRLCERHSGLWDQSNERRRAFNGLGGSHADSMFADFVGRVAREEWNALLQPTKHEDCDCMSCRPP